MPPQLVPVSPGTPPAVANTLTSHETAIRALQQPGAPSQLYSVALKASLPPADAWRACMILCDEINALCISTPVAGVYTWLRADGGAL